MSFVGVKMSVNNDLRIEEFLFYCVVRCGDVNVVESLLKYGVDFNEKDYREMIVIYYVNYLYEDVDRMVYVLLKFGGDMFSRNCYGQLLFEEVLVFFNKKFCEVFVDWGFLFEKCYCMYKGIYELFY